MVPLSFLAMAHNFLPFAKRKAFGRSEPHRKDGV